MEVERDRSHRLLLRLLSGIGLSVVVLKGLSGLEWPSLESVDRTSLLRGLHGSWYVSDVLLVGCWSHCREVKCTPLIDKAFPSTFHLVFFQLFNVKLFVDVEVKGEEWSIVG